MVKSPSVVAYHPEIPVRKKDGSVVLIKPDMDDYYGDDEVVGKLAAANPGCRTMGDLVRAVVSKKGESSQVANGVMSCCIEEAARDCDARGWDDPV